MEIERKFLVSAIPEDIESYPHSEIEQAYLNEQPVLRIRRRDDAFILTYKSKGMMVRQEHEFPLTQEAYEHLRSKADGNVITKTRYCIPYGSHSIELDVFHNQMAPLVMAEVEFASTAEAEAFVRPSWFTTEVTYDSRYHNVNMALHPDTSIVTWRNT